MILFTAKDFNMLHRGAALLGKRWAKRFPNHIEYKEQALINDWKEEGENYSKIVLLSQTPRVYTTTPSFRILKDISHIFTIRPDEHPALYDSATNCFSVYKANKHYKYFFPRFLAPPMIKNHVDGVTVGFYSRPNVNPDAVRGFMSFLDNLSSPVNVKILGENSIDYSNHKNIKRCSHTYDNKEFFSEISHFVYFHPVNPDPFPHTLLEAINLDKQIIIPNEEIQKDGVSDILSVTNFHKELNAKFLGNKRCLLREDLFIGFYHYLVSIEFKYSFDRDKYDSFAEWIHGEVIPRKEFRLDGWSWIC